MFFSKKDLKSTIGVFPTTFILDENLNIIYFKADSFEEHTKESLKELLIETSKKNL